LTFRANASGVISCMDEFRKIVCFYLDCLRRALSDTLAVFDLKTWRSVLNLVAPAAVVVLRLWWISTASERAEFFYYLKTCAVSIAAILGWAVLIFVGKFLAAPYRLRMESFLAQSFQLLFGQVGPYVQPQPGGTLYRLGIRNLSTVNTIEEVVAEVTNINPNPPAFLPLPLHIMHDNPPPGGQYQASFTLDADQTRFVDVVAILNIQGAQQFFLKHAVADVPENVLGPASQLTVTVRGQNCPPASRVLTINNVGGVFGLV
jgi:hypothetical protein